MNNTVELVGYYGSDETHALSAWTSTSRDLTDTKRRRMDKLLKMLAEQGHHTPFEKSSLHFLITCDTATHIQFLKHRIGVSVNTESARYKELKDDKFYIPVDWPRDMKDRCIQLALDSFKCYHQTMNDLIERGFTRERAKESARFLLPYANQVTMDIMFNFRSFMHFQGLRNKTDAQKEIRDLASEMLELVRNTHQFDMSLEGFGYG